KDDNLQDLTGLKYCKNLSSLSISGNIKNWNELNSLSNLKYLKINDCDTLTNLDFLKNNTELKTIKLLNNNHLNNIFALNNINGITQLQYSNLPKTFINITTIDNFRFNGYTKIKGTLGII
ncbi:MAG: hypothetical protein ACRDCB_14320, partial [Clostridium sp.]